MITTFGQQGQFTEIGDEISRMADHEFAYIAGYMSSVSEQLFSGYIDELRASREIALCATAMQVKAQKIIKSGEVPQ